MTIAEAAEIVYPLRKPTPSEREHELAMAVAARREPHRAQPTFKSAQVKGVGGTVVDEWEVATPVCDEYPTAKLALKAHQAFVAEMRKLHPATNGQPTNAATD